MNERWTAKLSFFANLIDRVQEILEEKAEEADFTGYLPGASTYLRLGPRLQFI